MKRLVKITALLLVLSLSMIIGACGDDHKGKAQTPATSDFMRGSDYIEVQKAFEKNGFTNVSFSKISDLVLGVFTKAGTVEKVEIDGTTFYDANVWVPADIEVVIYYHDFIYDDVNELIDEYGDDVSGILDDVSGSVSAGIDEITDELNNLFK